MRPFLVLALIAHALIGINSRIAVAQTTTNVSEKDKSAEQEVRRLNVEEVNAFLHKDPKAMAGLWSDDFVVTNPLNKFVNKQQVLGMMQSGFLEIPTLDRQMEYARVYGDTVIVAGNETVLWGGKMPNAGKTERLRFTAVWMKQNGRWQEVARHANIIPPQSQ
jgi:uncharacterized protein (TIGR02246 family)